MSIPLGYVSFSVLAGLRKVPLLNGVAVFFCLGIGVDHVFVFCDVRRPSGVRILFVASSGDFRRSVLQQLHGAFSSARSGLWSSLATTTPALGSCVQARDRNEPKRAQTIPNDTHFITGFLQPMAGGSSS